MFQPCSRLCFFWQRSFFFFFNERVLGDYVLTLCSEGCLKDFGVCECVWNGGQCVANCSFFFWADFVIKRFSSRNTGDLWGHILPNRREREKKEHWFLLGAFYSSGHYLFYLTLSFSFRLRHSFFICFWFLTSISSGNMKDSNKSMCLMSLREPLLTRSVVTKMIQDNEFNCSCSQRKKGKRLCWWYTSFGSPITIRTINFSILGTSLYVTTAKRSYIIFSLNRLTFIYLSCLIPFL